MASVGMPTNEEFPSNSRYSRERTDNSKEEIKPVTKGKVRPQSIGKRAKTAIFAEDARSVGEYILWDVVIPSFKQIISDMVTNGIERVLYGEAAPRRRSGTGSRIRYSNYSSYSRGELDSPGTPARQLSRRARQTFDFGEILLEDRGEGLEVIERLRDIVERYDIATVSDLYSLVGISSNYTDNDWGWRNLASANVQKVRDGYILILPDPEPVK